MKRVHPKSLPVSLDSLESRLLLSSNLSTLGFHNFRRGHDATAPAEGYSKALIFGVKPGTNITAPTNLSATATSATGVDLAWTPGSGANGYYLYRSTNGGAYGKIATLGSSVKTYADASVAASTAYSYYVVGYSKSTLSAQSNVASVSTPASAPVTLPAAAANLAVTGASASSISLSWSDLAGNESGYHVYRSSDGVNYAQVASLAANSQAFTDSGLPAGTAFSYEVSAWNSAGETLTAPVSGSTSAAPLTTPINIFTRYGGELVLAGTSGNDSIYVSQSGGTLTVTANGTTTTAAAPANGLFIYSFGGSDTITVDASVTLRTTIASIDGSDTTVTNADSNAGIWIDSTDAISGVGSVHKVAGFYQGVSKAIGINIADPTDAGNTFRANASLWGAAPVMGDVNQGGIGDCYFLSSLAAFANTTPAKLQDMAVDMGDGTYAVQYLRGGVSTVVRVDGDISTGPYAGYAFNHPGATGDLWAMIMEKSYAYFRSGANSYASLNSGWMGAVYGDLGVANVNLGLSTSESSFYNTVSTGLNGGKPVTFGTYTSPPNLVGSHAYTLVSTSIDASGHTLYVIRNPWGVSGDALENSAGYATLTFAQMQANFTMGTIAT